MKDATHYAIVYTMKQDIAELIADLRDVRHTLEAAVLVLEVAAKLPGTEYHNFLSALKAAARRRV